MAKAASLVVFVLLSLACHGPLSPFLPATYEPILLFYGQLYPPLAVALLGAVASTAAEYLNYYLYRVLLDCRSLDRLMRSNGARPVTALFGRRPFLAIWICAWSPLPDWAARILAAHSRYPVHRYLAAFVVGRIPKFWLLAAVGSYWMPSGGTAMAIAAGSGLLTLVGILRRRSRRVSTAAYVSVPEVALKTALLACLGFSLAGALPQRLAAQEPFSSRLEGISKGASLDCFIYEGTGATAFSFRLSGLRPGGLGPELSVSFFPKALIARALLFAPDFGAAYNVSIPHATLLIKAGGSALTGLASDVVLVPGAHVGAGIVVRIDERTGIRIDAARHSYFDTGETEAIWSIGLGFTALSPRRR
ncbi:MAG TPA: VTT domain-containing protein [Gemmatimonadales bacterium]|nr:VTT domain-containing protein [Gemmatimonadales bacterium]